MSSLDEDLIDSSIFQEPSDYYPPPKPATYESRTLQSGETLRLRLVGHSPLWVLTDYLYEHREELVRGKSVLELGAGAGLPSIAAAIWGAKNVVVTDYPDEDLVDNMRINVDAAKAVLPRWSASVVVQGHVWGADMDALLVNLPSDAHGFDTLILADLLFNHSQHAALVSTVQATLARTADAKALVFFTPYTPWKYDKDMAFFDLAREGGFVVSQVVKRVMDKVMFKDDRGDELLRRTVFGYEMSWQDVNV
ncbi:MAG: hypothetical protein LQ346_001929 [Caloplaca aetnensis]|nr:MAG: hypothetical protein LQ346_001929 [Caloplaca aetnensis]